MYTLVLKILNLKTNMTKSYQCNGVEISKEDWLDKLKSGDWDIAELNKAPFVVTKLYTPQNVITPERAKEIRNMHRTSGN